MCLIIFSFNNDSTFFKKKEASEKTFILLANRDEFYDRPTTPMKWWGKTNKILSGRDKLAGGTWFGVSEGGKFAALTNFKERSEKDSYLVSRGELVLNYLNAKNCSAKEYLTKIDKEKYAGFSLLMGDSKGIFFLSNRSDESIALHKGDHVLANQLLNTPTKKVEKTRQDFALFSTLSFEIKSAIEFMRSETNTINLLNIEKIIQKDEEELPLRFITSKLYGTRSTTIFSIDTNGVYEVSEQTYNNGGIKGKRRDFKFSPNASSPLL